MVIGSGSASSMSSNEENVTWRPILLLIQFNFHRSKIAAQSLIEQLRKIRNTSSYLRILGLKLQTFLCEILLQMANHRNLNYGLPQIYRQKMLRYSWQTQTIPCPVPSSELQGLMNSQALTGGEICICCDIPRGSCNCSKNVLLDFLYFVVFLVSRGNQDKFWY